jgi:hypothetical protein
MADKFYQSIPKSKVTDAAKAMIDSSLEALASFADKESDELKALGASIQEDIMALAAMPESQAEPLLAEIAAQVAAIPAIEKKKAAQAALDTQAAVFVNTLGFAAKVARLAFQ